MFLKSIKWRLQAWHGLLLVCVLAGFGVTAYQLERAQMIRRVDEQLQQRVNLLVTALRPLRRPPEGGGGPPPGQPPPLSAEAAGFFGPQHRADFYYVLWGRHDEPVGNSSSAPENVPLPEVSAATQFPLHRARGLLRENVSRSPGGEFIVVGCSLATELADLNRFAMWLAWGGVAVLVIGLTGGWWLATRAIRPVEEISAAARRISAGNLSERVNVAGADTELGELAATLNGTFSRLEDAFEQQRRFTSDAAHELRTPVTVILTHTQSSLTRQRAPEEYRESLEACQRAAQRMNRLIKALLQIARLDAGHDALKRQPLDLAVTVRDCAEMLRPLAEHHGLKLHCELPELKCDADAERLAQVFTNLLSNAVQYNRAGGEIRVTGARANGSVIVTVADTGPGIAAADLPHIFERFYRGDKSRTGGTGHAGLGLSICKAVVDAHGGEITAASVPGAGATFTVRLPGGDAANRGAH